MGFGEFFGFNKQPNKEGRENLGGKHQAVPNEPPGQISNQEIDNIDIKAEINRIKEDIETESKSTVPDMGKLEFLRNKLANLETQQ